MNRHSRAGGNLDRSVRKLIGKKGFLRFYVLDSHFRGNDVVQVRRNDVVQVSVRMDSSFPRRRESSLFGFSYFR
ncbi:AzlC-like protein [Neisseria meningitidis]|uniref:AzlC-like protein n=1 Tax=Neisseria meningitidis TaxID=487 RepID=A0A378VTH2_NEIME|nr:AzlC-like protein [Neisseria meningitidis]